MNTTVSTVTFLLMSALASNAYAGNCATSYNVFKAGNAYEVEGVEGSRSQWTSSTTATDINLPSLRFYAARIQKADPSRKIEWAVLCRYQDSYGQFITMFFKPNQTITPLGENWKNVTTDSFDREVKANTKSPSDVTEADITARDCVASLPDACPYQ